MPAGFDVEGLCLPFSFAADPGGQILNVDNVDFTGTVGFDLAAKIDNVNKYIVISGGGKGVVTALPGGSKGKLCAVNFSLVSEPADEPTLLKIAAVNRLEPLLFHQLCYSGIERERVFVPEIMRAPYGDNNSDQSCDISDAVWIINYIFIGGVRPGDLEPWE